MPWRERLLRPSVLAAAYVTLRASAVVGRTPVRFPDTVGYLTFDPLTPGSRLWPVTLVYAIVTSDPLRVAVHVAIGAAAWVWLAHETASAARWPVGARVLTLVVGLTPQVVRYDLAVLSESLTISLGVAVVAASLSSVRRRDRGMSWTWVVLFVTFCMARQPQILLLLVAGGTVVIVAVTRRRLPGARRVVLAFAAVVGVQQLASSSALASLNLYTLLAERVVTDDARFAWFAGHGMPATDEMRGATGYDWEGSLPPEVAARFDLPAGQAPPSLIRVGGTALLDWVEGPGWRTYVHHAVTHPSDTWTRLGDLAGPVLHPPNDDFLPLDSRTVVPRWVFPPWQLSLVLAGAGASAMLMSGRRRLAGVITLLVVSTAALYVAAVMGSGIEHPRHGAVSAVLLAVTALVATATVAPRRTTSPEVP